MSNQSLKDIWEIYRAARELPEDRRRAFVESSSPNPEQTRQVLELLEASGGDISTPSLNVSAPGLRAGAMFGHYRVGQLIGRGGMGEVYSAHDGELDRTVALKFLNWAGLASGAMAERFIREAKAASALNHPNIVTIYEINRAGGDLAIAMELVDGDALRNLLSGAPLPVGKAARIGRQVAEALGAAHAGGIVHRDIKPENIMVRRDGYVKVLDFGLARNIEQTSLAASIAGLPIGTLRYMSPEQARCETTGSAADVFSLGLVLYEAVTGQHPFAAESPFETVHGIMMLPAQPASRLNPLVPPWLDRLLDQMLAKEASARCNSVEVASRLAEGASESIPGRSASRRLYPALAVLAVAAALAGWAVFSNRRGAEPLQLRPVPLTSQTGWETSPALSPDGRAIAFAWSDRFLAPKQIHVKSLDETTPLKVFDADTGLAGSPAWSADGRRIYYKRWQDGIWSVSRQGGDNQKVVDLQNADPSSGLDCSPDGRWLAYCDRLADRAPMSVILLNLETRDRKTLTFPPKEIWGDWDPKFSPDGQTLAFKRVKGNWQDFLYLVPASGGTPKQLTFDGQGIWGHAWMREGKSLLVSCQRGGTVFGLWRFPIGQSGMPELIGEGGFDAIQPASARNASTIAWVNQVADSNIYGVPVAGGGTPVRLVASTRRDAAVTSAQDGRIAFLSDRSGSMEIWLARADGSQQTRVTNFLRGSTGSPNWSADGSRIVTTAYSDAAIVVLDCPEPGLHCGEPRRLPRVASTEFQPSWSSDGKFIYFASDQTPGTWNVWRMPAAGGPATQITRKGGLLQIESGDGRWLYFSRPASGIWRMPAPRPDGTEGGAMEQKLIDFSAKETQIWTLGAAEIFFFQDRQGSRGPAVFGYNLATKKIRQVFSVPSVEALAISADQRQLLYALLDRSGANVLVAAGAPSR